MIFIIECITKVRKVHFSLRYGDVTMQNNKLSKEPFITPKIVLIDYYSVAL